MKRSSVVAWAVALVLVSVAATARSDGKPDEILFLGLQKKGGANGGNKAVMKRIERMGEKVSGAEKSLSASDRTCEKDECLKKLASTRQVNWVLGGKVASSTARDYIISLWLYDARQSRVLEETGDCESCDEEQLANAISTLTGRLLEQRNTRAPAQETAAPPSDAKRKEQSGLSPRLNPVDMDTQVGSAATVTKSTDRKVGPFYVSTGRLIGAGALTAVALFVLANAIAFSITDVGGTSCPYTPTAGNGCDYNRVGMIGGYGLTGLLLAGATLTLVIP